MNQIITLLNVLNLLFQSFPRILLNARGHLSQLNDSGFSESPLLPSDLNELILYSVYGPGKYVPK